MFTLPAACPNFASSLISRRTEKGDGKRDIEGDGKRDIVHFAWNNLRYPFFPDELLRENLVFFRIGQT